MALLFVNNQRYTVELPADTPLLWVLRDHLHLVGTKYGCGMALCGACTVLVDGVATRSCTLPISAIGMQSGDYALRIFLTADRRPGATSTLHLTYAP